MFKTMNEAVAWITNRRSLSKGIESYRNLMEELGNPQDKIPSIHIAGTNGKGSTCAFIKDCLIRGNYKVGTFTSPHLVKHQDRIRINGQWISEKDFLSIVNTYKDIIEQHELNMFEIDFLIACMYFINQNVDIMVIEVGLGGRLDCTNSLNHPLISVITSIGLDHMELLGDTKEKIAIEKAGIIKQGGQCVVGEVESSVMNEIVTVANSENAIVFPALSYEKIDVDRFCVENQQYTVKSKANYQMRNATLAITVLNKLVEQGKINLTNKQIVDGIGNSLWEGRFETVSVDPLVILDGAHNDQGIDALIGSLVVCPKPWIVVFAALKDKPAKSMVSKLYDVVQHVIVTEFDFYRIQSCEQLKINNEIECIENFNEAIKKGMSLANKNGTLIICGSLYFISEVREMFNNEGDKK